MSICEGKPFMETLARHSWGNSPACTSSKQLQPIVRRERVKMAWLSLSSYKVSFEEHQIHNHTKRLSWKWRLSSMYRCDLTLISGFIFFPFKNERFTSQAWHCRTELHFPRLENTHCPLVILSFCQLCRVSCLSWERKKQTNKNRVMMWW